MKKHIQKTIALAGLSLILVAVSSLAAISNHEEFVEFVTSVQGSTPEERTEFFTSAEARVALDYALANSDIGREGLIFMWFWSNSNKTEEKQLAQEVAKVVADALLADELVQDSNLRVLVASVGVSQLGLNPTYRDQLLLTLRGTGEQRSPYRNWFRNHIKASPANEALTTIENEIRALLTRPASETRDNWIKELRAQHIILKTFVE